MYRDVSKIEQETEDWSEAIVQRFKDSVRDMRSNSVSNSSDDSKKRGDKMFNFLIGKRVRVYSVSEQGFIGVSIDMRVMSYKLDSTERFNRLILIGDNKEEISVTFLRWNKQEGWGDFEDYDDIYEFYREEPYPLVEIMIL